MRFVWLLAPIFLLDASPLVVANDPLIDPAQFRVTTFASGLSFPTSLTRLADGSIVVGTSIPNNPSYPSGFTGFATSLGQLIRFTDGNADGMADGPGIVVANLGGAVTYVRSIGDIVVVATTGNGSDPGSHDQSLVFLRQGANPTDPYTKLGTLGLASDNAALASASIAMALRPTAGQPGSFDVFFTLQAGDHLGDPIGSVTLTGLLTGSVAPGTILRFTATPSVSSVALSAPAEVASGVRSSAGIAFDANGSLVITDNGPEMAADELHVLTANTLGGSTFLGYPDNYPEYGTNTFVGGAGQQAFVAFQPLGAGESKGAADIVSAPSGFPSPLDNGFFVGFHGMWDQVGTDNSTNPVYFVNRTTGAYFPFLPSGQSGMSHPDGLLAAPEGLYVADMFTEFGFTPETGAVYLISFGGASDVPEPSSLALLGAGLVGLASLSARRRR